MTSKSREAFTTQLLPQELARLRALSRCTGRPIYSLVATALAGLLEAQPEELRQHVEDCAALNARRRGADQ